MVLMKYSTPKECRQKLCTAQAASVVLEGHETMWTVFNRLPVRILGHLTTKGPSIGMNVTSQPQRRSKLSNRESRRGKNLKGDSRKNTNVTT